jgi:acyl-coenzyme A thioesterase PaaI-like protein
MADLPQIVRDMVGQMIDATPQAAALGLRMVSAMATAAGTEPFSTATLDLRIDYMRPAAPRTGVICEAHCYKLTRSVGFVRAEAWDVDRSDLIATAQAAFILNRPNP